jgi:Protein of unknown function (DUF917)
MCHHSRPALRPASEVQLPREIERDELEQLATGAGILGAGGGGSAYLPWLNVRGFYAAGGRVALLDPADLADGDAVAVVADMGAPLVAQERLSDPAFAAKPVRMMEDYTGRPFRAVMAAEIGGGNAFQPLLVASATGLPVVDADATGRAFPEAQMASFAIAGLPMFPLALADIRDNEVIVTRAAGWEWTERIGRKVCTGFGSTVATCEAPRTGAESPAMNPLGGLMRFGRGSVLTDDVSWSGDDGACVRSRSDTRWPISRVMEWAGCALRMAGQAVSRRPVQIILCASACQSPTALAFSRPRTRKRSRPRLRHWALTHSAVAARSL